MAADILLAVRESHFPGNKNTFHKGSAILTQTDWFSQSNMDITSTLTVTIILCHSTKIILTTCLSHVSMRLQQRPEKPNLKANFITELQNYMQKFGDYLLFLFTQVEVASAPGALPPSGIYAAGNQPSLM